MDKRGGPQKCSVQMHDYRKYKTRTKEQGAKISEDDEKAGRSNLILKGSCKEGKGATTTSHDLVNQQEEKNAKMTSSKIQCYLRSLLTLF